MAKEYKDLVVGLDIGTAKVMAVVAEVLPNGDAVISLATTGVVEHPEVKPVKFSLGKTYDAAQTTDRGPVQATTTGFPLSSGRSRCSTEA